VAAKKNIIYSFFIKIGSILTGLTMVPLTINYINQSQYGIWLTLSSVIAWLSFFDIGFGNGLRNKFAEHKAKGKYKDVKIYVSTTYGVLSLIFLAVWVLFFFINNFLNWDVILNAPKALSKELSLVALITISFFCIQIVFKTITTILIADQKPAKAALVSTLGQIFSLLIIYILIKTTSGSLTYLALAIGAGPVFVLLLTSIFFFNGPYKCYSPSIKYVQIKYAKDIMSLGLKFFIIQIAVIVIYQTTNIIIAQVSGPNDVTVYNIVFKYFSVSVMLFSIVITPFWSAFTEAMSLKDYEWMKKSFRNLFKILIGCIILTIIMLIFSDYAYHIWIADLVKIDLKVSIAVCAFIILNLWNMLFSQLLNGMGKIKLQLIVSILITILNIPLAIYLGQLYGNFGVVMSSVFLSLISAIYAPYQLKLLLNNQAKGIWNE
jgi:O-antigen/teichoic acid export membrane protein